MKQNTLQLGITTNYCRDWSLQDAIREILANALDTHSKIDVDWQDGTATVRDYGTGLQPRGLLLGESTKTNNDIGQFGEGLKVGAMVMLRYGQQIRAESNGTCYTFSMAESAIGTDVLTIKMSPCKFTERGTRVIFTCPQDELEATKKRFLQFTPIVELDKNILDAAGQIYVKGLFTQRMDTCLGYNLQSKDAMNRDRNTLNHARVESGIYDLLRVTKSAEVVRRVIDQCCRFDGSKFEEANIDMQIAHPKLWKDTFYSIFGDMACIATENQERAKYLGYKLVNLAYGIRHTLIGCGVKTSAQVAPEKNLLKVIGKDNLTAPERININVARRILDPIFGMKAGSYRIMVCEGMKDADGNREGDIVRLNRRILKNQERTVAVLFHELCHSYGRDCDSSFEAALTTYGGKLAMATLGKKNKKAIARPAETEEDGNDKMLDTMAP